MVVDEAASADDIEVRAQALTVAPERARFGGASPRIETRGDSTTGESPRACWWPSSSACRWSLAPASALRAWRPDRSPSTRNDGQVAAPSQADRWVSTSGAALW